MSHKAERTAQPHVLAVRPNIRAMLPDPKVTSTPYLPKFPNREFTDADMKQIRAEMKRLSLHPNRGYSASAPHVPGWYYELRAGHLCTRFAKPLTWNVVEQAFYEGMIKDGKTADTSPFVAKIEGKLALVKQGDGIGDNDDHERKDIIAGRVTLLTMTTKMGCYSWNLPAGPPFKGGTCPGSLMAFYVEPDDEKSSDRKARIMGAISRAKKSAIAQFASSLPGGIEEAIDRFVCNGCYAMKGAYGNPSVISVMEWRRKWLEQFALPSGQFETIMEFCIRLAQYKSRKALRKRGVMTPEQIASVPHPNYFRIHDAGDFFDKKYFESWLRVCRKMKDIHFWAPTRMWIHESNRKWLNEAIKAGKIPSNLALRPSGLFFDGPEPFIAGLSSGTSSSNITFRVERGGKIKLDIQASDQNAWGCPAYMPQQIGGGAVPKIPKKKSKEPKPNPAQQSYAMYPPIDESTPESKDFVFYQALVDPKTGRYIIDPGTGRPMTATQKNVKAHPGAIIQAAQTFQAAGSCSVARDPNHAQECRVCWGTTGDKRAPSMKSLPVVYAKH